MIKNGNKQLSVLSEWAVTSAEFTNQGDDKVEYSCSSTEQHRQRDRENVQTETQIAL